VYWSANDYVPPSPTTTTVTPTTLVAPTVPPTTAAPTTTTVAPTTTTTAQALLTAAPASPPFVACGPNRDPSMSSPYATFTAAKAAFPNTAYVDVSPGDNSQTIVPAWLITANTTYYLEPGVHTLGAGPYGQIQPKDGDVFVGAPGAILDGAGVNYYAFTTQPNNVTIEYLEVRNFTSGDNEGVINHDLGNGWLMKWNWAHDNHGGAMLLGQDNVAEYNCLDNNGQYGFQAFESNINLSYNEISNNDTENIQNCGCQGGGKFWGVKGGTVTYNYVHDNKSVGLWADTNDVGFDISHNYVTNNADEAIFYEASYNFRIDFNTIIGNTATLGKNISGFPVPTIYISESGGDSRVGSTFAQSEVAHNVLTDNFGGVVLWENTDRYCGSVAAGGSYCPIANPTVATTTTCQDPTKIGTVPYIDDCRWKTQNVSVFDNTFSLTQANVAGCTHANECGFNAIVAQVGTNQGNGDPYLGTTVEDHIINQNNRFSNNRYAGYWSWQVHEMNNVVPFGTWQSTYGQDAGSTLTP
jgi:hypothetical protein